MNHLVHCHFFVLHQNRLFIPQTFRIIEQVLMDAAKAKSENRIADMVDNIAFARFLFAQASPWVRGSAAISEWIETLIFRALGYPDFPLRVSSGVDLQAFSMTFDCFKMKYARGVNEACPSIRK